MTHERLARGDHFARCHDDFLDDAGDRGFDAHLHFHRLEDYQFLTSGDAVAFLHEHGPDIAGDGGSDEFAVGWHDDFIGGDLGFQFGRGDISGAIGSPAFAFLGEGFLLAITEFRDAGGIVVEEFPIFGETEGFLLDIQLDATV